jgi:hypothetical protein
MFTNQKYMMTPSKGLTLPTRIALLPATMGI